MYYLAPSPRLVYRQRPVIARRATATAHPQLRYTQQKTEDGQELRFSLPGYARENIQVSIAAGTLTLQLTAPEQDARYLRREFAPSTQPFTLSLSKAVDADAIRAELADGVLTLSLPHLNPAKKQVAVA